MSDSNVPESASLLRRLGEAADGYRDGILRIIIARRDPPHDVAGVFAADDPGIDDALAAAGQGYEKFGPYLTPQTESFTNAAHDVVSVTVTFRRQAAQVFSAAEYDALIWSIPAFDKLIMPYITAVSGADHAARMRASFVAGSVIGHKLYSF